MNDVFVVRGYRSAFGKAGKGQFRYTRPDTLGIRVLSQLRETLEASGFDINRVDDLIVGNALPEAEQGLNMARYIALGAGLPQHVAGATLNRYCASGLETIAIAHAKIAIGHADCILAGGAESMSLVPMGGYKVVPNQELTAQHPEWYFSMGLTAEAVAKEYGITREDCDEFAYHSNMRAAKAVKEGVFDDDIVPIDVEHVYVEGDDKKTQTIRAERDEGPRPNTTMEGLAKLRPVFTKDGISTAGNSSQTTDGAAFVMLASEAVVKEYNLDPIARLVGYGIAGVDPKVMGIGPVEAVPKALKNAGLTIGDIAATELNEAFATQSVAVIRELGLDPETTNPNGGAIALGHPLGCTGAKLSMQAIREAKALGGKHALVTACVGGGQGIAGIFEVL